jgi:RNA polymerase sigma-70 factor (ECF subfamily)
MSTDDRLRREIVEMLPRLRRFARTLTRHIHDADDLVQMALERALRKLDSWQAGTRLDSWLFTIVRNAWIDEVRARMRRNEVVMTDTHADSASTDHSAVHDALAIQDAMARLPDDQRIAIGLVLVEGLPYKEAAAVLDIPIGTLTSRLARGRDALQKQLRDPTVTSS